jgi:hypothetical protein
VIDTSQEEIVAATGSFWDGFVEAHPFFVAATMGILLLLAAYYLWRRFRK